MIPWFERLQARIGRATGWFVLIMILVAAANALLRYGGRFIGRNLSSNALLEGQWYLFSLVFLLGAGHTLASGGHVRVDVVYSRLSQRGRALVDAFGTLFFLLPFTVVGLWVSWVPVRNSWRLLEGSPDPGGLPRYPIKTMILVGFFLLLLQGLAELVKNLERLRGAARDPDPETEQDGRA